MGSGRERRKARARVLGDSEREKVGSIEENFPYQRAWFRGSSDSLGSYQLPMMLTGGYIGCFFNGKWGINRCGFS